MKQPTEQQLNDLKWWDINAPEGATHFDPEDEDTPWMKKMGNKWSCYNDKEWSDTFGSGDEWIAIENGPERCIPRPTQWQGPQDGDPPVGTAVRYPTGQGVVRLESDLDGVLIVEEDGLYKRVAADGCQPIQSERDKAIEEMLADFERISGYSSHVKIPDLYDAGYRKQMSRDEAHERLTLMMMNCDNGEDIRDLILDALGYKE